MAQKTVSYHRDTSLCGDLFKNRSQQQSQQRYEDQPLYALVCAHKERTHAQGSFDCTKPFLNPLLTFEQEERLVGIQMAGIGSNQITTVHFLGCG